MPSNLRKKLLDEIWKYITHKVVFSKSEVFEILDRYAVYAAKNQCASLTKYNPEKYATPISPTNLPEHIEEVKKEWCEHWDMSEAGYWAYKHPDCPPHEPIFQTALPDRVPNFCGWCGTPRPAPQEKKLYGIMKDCSGHSWQECAEAAKAHIISKIPSAHKMWHKWKTTGSTEIGGIEAVRELVIKAVENA